MNIDLAAVDIACLSKCGAAEVRWVVLQSCRAVPHSALTPIFLNESSLPYRFHHFALISSGELAEEPEADQNDE